MCGEVAGDQTAVHYLLVWIRWILNECYKYSKTRSLMKRLDTSKMEELVDKAINEATSNEEVMALVEEYTK